MILVSKRDVGSTRDLTRNRDVAGIPETELLTAQFSENPAVGYTKHNAPNETCVLNTHARH